MNKIRWLKWQDPLAPLVDGKPAKTYSPDEDEHEPAFVKARATFGRPPTPKPPKRRARSGFTGPAVLGQFGVVPLHESNLPSALFNFWMGDTNFDLTEEVRNTIESVPGVETLDLYTRYRFRVGIGRAFDQNEVKSAIEVAVQPPPPPAPPAKRGETHSRLAALKKLLGKRFKYWAIVSVGGKQRQFGGDSREEVEKKCSDLSGPTEVVARSWEEQ